MLPMRIPRLAETVMWTGVRGQIRGKPIPEVALVIYRIQGEGEGWPSEIVFEINSGVGEVLVGSAKNNPI